MKKNSLKVALNMSTLSVPDKINKATTIVAKITASPVVFASPNPALATVTLAIKDLQTAWENAQDGGKTLTAIVHDKEGDLMKLMNDLAHYVEGVAGYDENTIHLAGMDVKKKTTPGSSATFEAKATANIGEAKVHTKYVKNTFYKWQYCPNPIGTWVDYKTTSTSKIIISGLTSGTKYWFRVALIDVDGEHPFGSPVSCAVL